MSGSSMSCAAPAFLRQPRDAGCSRDPLIPGRRHADPSPLRRCSARLRALSMASGIFPVVASRTAGAARAFAWLRSLLGLRPGSEATSQHPQLGPEAMR